MEFLFESGLTISNSAKDASKDSKWSNPGASLYDKIMESSNWKALLREAYLIGDVDKIKKNETSYSASGCKYPHHKIIGDKLVVSEAGIKAAYSRAKQMGIFNGKVKSHIIKHYKELGLLKDSNINESFNKIINNFNDIELLLEAVRSKTVSKKKLYPVYIVSRLISKDSNTETLEKLKSSKYYSYIGKITNRQILINGISFDKNLKNIYSLDVFTDQKENTVDHIDEGNYSSTRPLDLKVCFVTKQMLDKLKSFFTNINNNLKNTKFLFTQLLKTIATNKIPTSNNQFGVNYNFVCSAIIGYLIYLANFEDYRKNYNGLDLSNESIIPYVYNVMKAPSLEWKKKSSYLQNDFKQRVDKIYSTNIEKLSEYNNYLKKEFIQSSLSKSASYDELIINIIKYYFKRG